MSLTKTTLFWLLENDDSEGEEVALVELLVEVSPKRCPPVNKAMSRKTPRPTNQNVAQYG